MAIGTISSGQIAKPTCYLNILTPPKRLPTPAGHAEAFTRLRDAGLLPQEHIPTYLVMVRFRNRLVHVYAEVSDAEVYRVLQSDLGDFRAFLADLAQILALEPPTQCCR